MATPYLHTVPAANDSNDTTSSPTGKVPINRITPGAAHQPPPKYMTQPQHQKKDMHHVEDDIGLMANDQFSRRETFHTSDETSWILVTSSDGRNSD